VKTPKKSDISRLPYRKGVGLMIFNDKGEILVARRIDMVSEAWQMPQGGIDGNETPEQAARREMKEEIGTDKAEIVDQTPKWLTYDLPEDLVPKIWHGRFRGQKQKWFLARFTGRDDDVRIDTEHPEFLDWRWAPLHSLPRLIVPFKKKLYADLVAEFGPRVRRLTGKS
jgi:putative (di)nucleoside polyphosphate hydrolase